MRVEIPKGSLNKYEYNEDTQQLELDRVLVGNMPYPELYGSIPNTLAEDGDPLDVICIIREPIDFPCLVPIRVLGLMEMIDNGKQDDKIVAVNAVDPHLIGIQSLADLDETTIFELINFFSHYKDFEGKTVKVMPDFKSKEYAENKISECQARFKNEPNQ
ncbi:1183_t:CDS:1 [Paraglomus brasilianum]|uniref:inorganic diphosphatase n=1 Tax=Paraglomus brasilianum TaxID=144538 RepID=A0A9N9AYV5_9GLOM|nr:1183_t:CDS:1 [Paraglomus brasilianum]